MSTRKLSRSRSYVLALAVLLIYGVEAQAENIYIDATQETPVVWSDSSFYWTSGPFDGLHSSVTQIDSGHWAIDIGLVGAFRGTGSNRGLELTDPETGEILNSFGVNWFVWNDQYSWTTLYTELFTLNGAGELAGRTGRIANAPVATAVIVPDTYQLAMSGINTEWHSWNIWLKGMEAEATSDPGTSVPEPATLALLVPGLLGLTLLRSRRA